VCVEFDLPATLHLWRYVIGASIELDIRTIQGAKKEPAHRYMRMRKGERSDRPSRGCVYIRLYMALMIDEQGAGKYTCNRGRFKAVGKNKSLTFASRIGRFTDPIVQV
jgi:hypothetical protein